MLTRCPSQGCPEENNCKRYITQEDIQQQGQLNNSIQLFIGLPKQENGVCVSLEKKE